jgi:hypothetical protein
MVRKRGRGGKDSVFVALRVRAVGGERAGASEDSDGSWKVRVWSTG